MRMNQPTCLADVELVAEVARLARSERYATATLIARLAELYCRRLHEKAGYDSLFTYCVAVLGLSESAAYDRMKAAKVARRFPSVLTLLEEGRVNLTTIRLVAPHLTRENHGGLLEEVCGKRKREVQEVLARRFPQADVRASIRKLPSRPAPAAAVTGTRDAGTATPVVPPTMIGGASPVAAGQTAASAAPVPVPARYRAPVTPLSPARCQFTFTGNTSAREKLEMAQDLLRHSIPDGDPAQVFERALDVLLDELVKRKFAVTKRPGRTRAEAKDPADVAAEVKRIVYIRDRGRCAYVGAAGHRCGARAFLEFHHLVPRAVGGKGTSDNISLRCRAHNQYEAEVFYGPIREYGGAGLVKEVKGASSFWNDSDGGGPRPSRGASGCAAPAAAG